MASQFKVQQYHPILLFCLFKKLFYLDPWLQNILFHGISYTAGKMLSLEIS